MYLSMSACGYAKPHSENYTPRIMQQVGLAERTTSLRLSDVFGDVAFVAVVSDSVVALVGAVVFVVCVVLVAVAVAAAVKICCCC